MLNAGDVRLAIEGGSASGKSTLARMLADIYGCTLFHMDDFFLTPSMRTEARLAEAGGNVDRERFLAEVLTPLSRGEEIAYRRYDCSTGEIMPPESKEPTSLTVTEGAYSMHPELANFYNLSVFLEITPELQRARILKRNSPEMAERHFSAWIPMEERYFDTFNIRERCDVTLHAQEI
jgi:uridine kinase